MFDQIISLQTCFIRNKFLVGYSAFKFAIQLIWDRNVCLDSLLTKYVVSEITE